MLHGNISASADKLMETMMITGLTTGDRRPNPLAIEYEARRARAQMLRAGVAALGRGLSRLLGRGGAAAGTAARA